MYINENDDRVVYLLNSNYIEPAVWERVLELNNREEAYTTESLMRLLHIAYPDRTTQLDKVQIFMNVKQTHPMVAIYK